MRCQFVAYPLGSWADALSNSNESLDELIRSLTIHRSRLSGLDQPSQNTVGLLLDCCISVLDETTRGHFCEQTRGTSEGQVGDKDYEKVKESVGRRRDIRIGRRCGLRNRRFQVSLNLEVGRGDLLLD